MEYDSGTIDAAENDTEEAGETAMPIPAPEPPAHKYYRTTMQDNYKNYLYTCNCPAGKNVTGTEQTVRAHCLDELVDRQFAGDVGIAATSFTPTTIDARNENDKLAEAVQAQILRMMGMPGRELPR